MCVLGYTQAIHTYKHVFTFFGRKPSSVEHFDGHGDVDAPWHQSLDDSTYTLRHVWNTTERDGRERLDKNQEPA